VRKNSFEGLNSSQVEAVSHGEGPILVLAGPGSGKTRVIAHRIAYLINDLLVPPEKILAMTFTNKMAREMKQRIEDLVGDRVNGIWIGTFHSICLRILKREVDFLEGYTKDFVIYDRSDQEALIKTCLEELSYGRGKFLFKEVLSEFDRVENQEDGVFKDDPEGRIKRKIYDSYKYELRKRNAMTFNDLFLLTNRLFSEKEEVCVRYQDGFSCVLVDEYQDTNSSQHKFAKILSQRHRNLFVVGDDSQSIYGWRGADINNILNFEKNFSGAKLVKLERNYRSTSTILGIANASIEKNLKRRKKTLWTENPVGEKAVVFQAIGTADEARFVAKQISQLVKSGNFTLDDIAILYRMNFQSGAIEGGLSVQKIPYRLVSGNSFYERTEIKDMIAYLRLIQNPKDNLSFERIVNVPPRGIDKKRNLYKNIGFSNLYTACEKKKSSLDQEFQELFNFLTIIKELRSEAENKPAYYVIKALLERISYLDYLGEDYEKVESVKEFLNIAEVYRDRTLSDFLNFVFLATNKDREDSVEEEVSLMTVHAAKGLEFPVVFMIGMNKDQFPHQRSMSTPEELEEERRLFYVAITRAENLLYLSYSSNQSIFLDDLPLEHIVRESRETEFAKQDSEKPPI